VSTFAAYVDRMSGAVDGDESKTVAEAGAAIAAARRAP
jgi:hypothetical protein